MKFALLFLALIQTQAFSQTAENQTLKSVISIQQAQIATLQSQIIQPCDGTQSADKSYCYKYFAGPLSHPNAALACTKWGGRLASIHNEEETNLIARLFTRGTLVWIGAIRIPSGFAWTDGTDFTQYTRWHNNEPNNANNSENCAVTGFHWNESWGDFDCSMQAAYVCKRSLVH